MRIVFVAPFGLGKKTTVWARILPLAQVLAAHGHHVTILIPPWDTPQDGGTQRTDAGVDIRQVAVWGGLPLILLRMIGTLVALRPDIVHIVKPLAYAGMVQWVLWQIRRLPGLSRIFPRFDVRLVLDIDDWERAWTPINGYSWPVRRFVAWQEEWGIRHADAITAASRWLTERAGEYAPQTPVLYLPNGITPPEQVAVPAGLASSPSPAPMVLYFSRFIEVEPPWLVAFWQELRRLHPAARLCIAGSALQVGREAEFTREFEMAFGPGGVEKSVGLVNAGVEFRGFVQPETLADLYKQADCAIFPARPVPLQQAKCSVRLVTTLLHGVPVVASAVGQQREYGADGAAVLVPAGATPAEFARAVSTVLDEPAQQQALASRAQAHLLARYAWSRLGVQLDQFYRLNRLSWGG